MGLPYKNKKPVIGIVAKPLLNKQLVSTLWSRLVINDEFRSLIYSCGGIPIGIMPGKYENNADTFNIIECLDDSDKEDLFRSLNMVNGIILQGGLTADTYEIEIVKYALKNNIPIMGICAGFNNIARTLNIPVIEKRELADIHDVYDMDYRHSVHINSKHPLSYLFKETTLGVNSLHCMFVENKDLPSDIDVLATSDDGHVEAFSINNTKFCLAVKWHPEIMKEPEQKAIFDLLIKAASE